MKKFILGLVFILGSFSFFANAADICSQNYQQCISKYGLTQESACSSSYNSCKTKLELDSASSQIKSDIQDIVIPTPQYTNTDARQVCLKTIQWFLKTDMDIVDTQSDLIHANKREQALEYGNLEIELINDLVNYYENTNKRCSDIDIGSDQLFKSANKRIQTIKDAINYNNIKVENTCQTSESILACNLGGGECPSQCINKFQNTGLQDAISWMYNKGLTKYNTITDFMSDDYLTREQASKFFSEFSKQIIGLVVDTNKKVSLKDLKKANPTLQSYIKEANQLGLFNGIKGNFFPSNKLTRAQAIAVIIRAYKGVQNENGSPRYTVYFNFANEYSLLTGLSFDFDSLDNTNIKRGEVALLLYRLNLYKQNVAK